MLYGDCVFRFEGFGVYCSMLLVLVEVYFLSGYGYRECVMRIVVSRVCLEFCCYF